MKNIPKILQILIILQILAHTAIADENEKKAEGTRLGVRGGVHITAMGPLDWSFGWHAGAVSDVATLTNFEFFGSLYGIFLQPGLYFSTRESIWNKSTYWLEVPVLLSLKRQSKSSTFFTSASRFEIGPYVNIGVLGDYKDNVVNAIAGDEEDQMSRFDLGITVTAGYELGILMIYTSYSRGFINVSDYYDAGTFCWKIIGVGLNF